MNFSNKLSVHVPVFNSEKTIHRCMDSIFSQSYQNFDLYIYEDCSTDNTIEILEKYKKKYNFTLIKNKENLGLIKNFNQILKNVNTEFFAIYHSDEKYDKDILYKELNFLEKNKNQVGAVFTNGFFDIQTSKKKIIGNRILKKNSSIYNFDEIFNLVIKYYNILIASSAMFVTKDIKEIGLFDKNYGMSIDLNYWFRILKKKNIGILNENLISTYLDGSASFAEFNKVSKSDFFIVMDEIIQKHYKYKLSEDQKKYYTILIYRDYCRIIRNYYKLKNKEEIFKIFKIFEVKFILLNLLKSRKMLVVLYVYIFVLLDFKFGIGKITEYFLDKLFKKVS